MIDPAEAQRVVLEATRRLPAVSVALPDLPGLVLAEDIVAGHPMPPFTNSAMDGYAVRSSDTNGASDSAPVSLALSAELPAGRALEAPVGPGEAVKIMTGAPVPPGADAVVQIELTRSDNGAIEIAAPVSRGSNIRRAGEELAEGDTAVKAGTVVDYVTIGILASLGYSLALVYRRPKAAVIATGNELVPVESPLKPGKIRDSNSYALAAQAKAAGAAAENIGVARDTKNEVKKLVGTALSRADIVLTSGGVSVGDYDYVGDVLDEMGGRMLFWGVNQKPGKPFGVWTIGDKLVFGLPGNPVAGLVCFEEYVRPAILKMMGRDRLFRPQVAASLIHDYKKKPGRTAFIGVRVRAAAGSYECEINGRQSSGMLKSIAGANGLAFIPAETVEIKAGEKVAVHLTERPEDH